jgi:hypothetical protein
MSAPGSAKDCLSLDESFWKCFHDGFTHLGRCQKDFLAKAPLSRLKIFSFVAML